MPRYVLCLVMSMVFLPDACAFDPWPQWRGPNRYGISAEEGLLDHWRNAPPLVWKAEGIGEGYSSVVVDGGLECTLCDRDGKTFVIALREKDGKEAWSTYVAGRNTNCDIKTVHWVKKEIWTEIDSGHGRRPPLCGSRQRCLSVLENHYRRAYLEQILPKGFSRSQVELGL